MKFCVLFLAVVAVSYGNPYADEGVWRWTPKMPTVTPNIRSRPFLEAIIPKIPRRHAAINPAIVEGQEATPHDYPWQVALYIDDAYFCGGSLISDSWVLTAAHCTTGSRSIEVVLGAHDLSVNEPTQVTVSSTNIITHPDYGSALLRNDLGLVEFRPVTLTPEIQPVNLPCRGDSEVGGGVQLTATGWGKTSDNSNRISDILKEVTDPSLTNNQCADTYGSLTITDDTICIDYVNGGTCNGDSGGPLILTSGGTTVTRGVTSFVSSQGCESGAPDGFTRTLHFLDFIEENTGIEIC